MFENGYKAASLFFNVGDDMDLVFEEISHIKKNVDYDGIYKENKKMRVLFDEDDKDRGQYTKKSTCCCGIC
jgi:hypothetical protein